MSRHRARRIADLIRVELARMLREEVRDPRIGFVTLTDIDLSADLRHARVYVSVLLQDPEDAIAALTRASPFLRRGLARNVDLRFTPELRFLRDPAVDAGSRVEGILEQIHDDEEPVDPDEPAADEERR